MATTATLTTYLAEAEAALHRLLTGSQTERLMHGDTQVAYTRANISELRAYINDLKAELGQTANARTRARRFILG